MAGPNSLEQTRVTELELYTPGGVGQPPLSEVVILVDHPTFNKPRRLPYDYAGSSITGHRESDKLESLQSANVNQAFNSPFTVIPIMVSFSVYRMKEIVAGKYRREDVLYYGTTANWLTIAGFSIVIDASEDLSGVIIEYVFEE